MLFGYLTLATALIISLSAAVYSILGLTAIFAAAFWPIVVMGGSLEVGKIVATLWLHKYWDRAEIQYKAYLCFAVAILMLLTSMGVFGFLSKAHTDQSLVSGDAGAKIAIYDEKIKISRDNIDANRRALTQMDAAVDQVMGRSTDEKGADKAVSIRRSQQAERGRLLKEIEAEQKKITALNEERAPLAAENRKIEAEVGPIKYIAALIYGDNPEANVLEKSVRWVIILIVIVFDPLALTLLLAATKSLEWERGINIFNPKKRDEDEEAQELSKDDLEPETQPTYQPLDGDVPVFDEREEIPLEEPEVVEDDMPFKGRGIQPSMPLTASYVQPIESESKIELPPAVPPTVDAPEHIIQRVEETKKQEEADPLTKLAKVFWTMDNPGENLDNHHVAFHLGESDKLPWHNADHINNLPISDRERKELVERANEMSLRRELEELKLEADNLPTANGTVKGFGTSFPTDVVKGDMFLRVDRLPSALYKFNGVNWIEVDKALSDQHAYDTAYIDHLISKLESGEYDPDLLSDAERDQIDQRLTKKLLS